MTIDVSSGRGGDGAVSFRREKYVPMGGPDGGDGGRGGDIVLESDASLNSLGNFRFQKKFQAAHGENGTGNNRSGKDAKSLCIKVPVGTVVFDEKTGYLLYDFTEDGQSYVVAAGGRGGNGNQHYANATRQAPRFSKPGDESVKKKLILELKTIADVGLVGFPNVGKSTLLSKITNAKPKIANYHFTTLSPNLGIVAYKDADDFVVADIPGLIEGASEGVGLGHDFLRHIERTKMIVHIIDASGSEGRDPIEDFGKINAELAGYSQKLAERVQVVALNKCDLISSSQASKIKSHFAALGYDVFAISAATGKGVGELLDFVISILPGIESEVLFFTEEDIEIYSPAPVQEYETKVENGIYYLSGIMPTRLLRSVNLSDYESSTYFARVLKGKGILKELEDLGMKDGDTLNVCGFSFEYYS